MKFPVRRGGVPADVRARADLPAGRRCWPGPPPATAPGCSAPGGALVLIAQTPPGCPRSGRSRGRRSRTRPGTATRRRLQLAEVGEYGEPRPSYAFEMEEPALLLQLVRERVTASIVLQRRVPVRGKLGLTVIGRRSPVGGPVAWMHAYDAGLDPADPEVARRRRRGARRGAWPRSGRRRQEPDPDLATPARLASVCGRDPL